MPFFNNSKANVVVILLVMFFISACSSSKKSMLQSNGKVKNYPKNTPFVYNHSISIDGNIDANEKQRLLLELNKYWDDSLQVRKKSSWVVFKAIEKPAVYDSSKVDKSIKYMDGYLKTQGYYYATFTRDTNRLIKKDQHRVLANVHITLNKNIRIDSIAYDLLDTSLRKIAKKNMQFSLLKKDTTFTKQLISNELDRLTTLFNRNGYYNFRKDDLYALVDTTDKDALKLTTDPFELPKLISEYEKRKKENPKWHVFIKQRKDTSGESSKQYFVGHIYYYPQAKNFDLIDTTINRFWLHSHTTGNYTLKFDKENIEQSVLEQFTFLKNGNVFDNTKLFTTVSALGRLGTWKQVDVKCIKRGNDSIDIHLALVPDKKHGIENSAEISRNIGDLTSGNFVGLSENFTFRNRNVFKQAIQSFTTLRVGVELAPTDSSSLLQTFFASINQQYAIPKKINILPFKIRGLTVPFRNGETRTLINLNANYTDRFDLFKLRSFTANFGYESRKENNTFYYNPLNIELYSLEKKPRLDTLIAQNPFLQLSFNTGNVVGQTATYLYQHNNVEKQTATFLKAGIEWSGLLLGLFTTTEDNLYRYVKFDADFRYSKKYKKDDELAIRTVGGLGFNISSSNQLGVVLPFFKQFFVGGPNSMRAWGLRQLGQGSSILRDTSSSTFKDRFGDIKFETNIEYRFNVFKTSFVKVASAVYADIGNVWNLKKDVLNKNSEFNFGRFYKDIGIGIGTGLRFDFSIFLIRIDAAYKIKDPAREYNDGWVNLKSMSLTEHRSNGAEIRNASIQLGIGLPF